MSKLVAVGLLLAALAGCSTNGAGPEEMAHDGGAMLLLPAPMSLSCHAAAPGMPNCSTM